jgi:hypothetical protein
MMKKTSYNILYILVILLVSCKDDDINLFEKTADERAADAIATLKADLIAPANGWRIKYRPVDDAGSYYVLMSFNEDNKVTIKTDLSAEDGKYFEETISYRIDNSMGIELILENYSFFSFLFEQEQASFGAEYEFDFVNKTPDNLLVFSSKTDVSNPTIIVFEQAAENEAAILGQNLSMNLSSLETSQNFFASSTAMKIAYAEKDIAIYFSLDIYRRIADFNFISSKNDLQGQALALTTGYVLKSDSIVFDNPLNTSFNGNNISLKSLYLNTMVETTMEFCPAVPVTVPVYGGSTSAGDVVTMETTLFNNSGADFKESSEIYIADILNVITAEGERAAEQIEQDIAGAAVLVIYNNADSNEGPLNAVGFLIENSDETTSIAVKKYTSVLTGNILELTFDPEITFVRNPETDADVNNINIYLDLMTQGGKTYIYKLDDQFYELYNPCSGWSFAFQRI